MLAPPEKEAPPLLARREAVARWLSNPGIQIAGRSMKTLPHVKGVLTASRMSEPAVFREWRLQTVAGRLVEISSAGNTAALTLAATLILEAQHGQEPVAWVSARESIFFPPDFAAAGIDLAALPVVRIEDIAKAARVTDTLLRSGGFGLVVLDLDNAAGLPMAAQTRLAGLAKRHHAALLCLTRREGRTPNLGSLVSLRCESSKQRVEENRFTCELRVMKDKRRSLTWQHTEVCHGPDGMC